MGVAFKCDECGSLVAGPPSKDYMSERIFPLAYIMVEIRNGDLCKACVKRLLRKLENTL